MIEKKSFFTENNHLNKGYKSQAKSLPSKRSHSIDLPESSVLAAYEDISPGTIAHIVEMAKKEQEHRHKLEILQIKMEKTALRVGRIFGIFLAFAICYTSFSLYLHDLVFSASLFGIIGFITLAIPALFSRCGQSCGMKKRNVDYSNKPHNRNFSNRDSNNEQKMNPQSSKPQHFHRRRKRT
ncbi:MAG: hypothetical protein RLZZ59_730 [Pseudomonadota bacterium]|jgi:uncharacterized membrane protein